MSWTEANFLFPCNENTAPQFNLGEAYRLQAFWGDQLNPEGIIWKVINTCNSRYELIPMEPDDVYTCLIIHIAKVSCRGLEHQVMSCSTYVTHAEVKESGPRTWNQWSDIFTIVEAASQNNLAQSKMEHVPQAALLIRLLRGSLSLI